MMCQYRFLNCNKYTTLAEGSAFMGYLCTCQLILLWAYKLLGIIWPSWGESLPGNKAGKREAETTEVKKSSWVKQLEHLDLTIPEGEFLIKSHFCLDYFELSFYQLQMTEFCLIYLEKPSWVHWEEALCNYPSLGLQRGCVQVAVQWFQRFRWWVNRQ